MTYDNWKCKPPEDESAWGVCDQCGKPSHDCALYAVSTHISRTATLTQAFQLCADCAPTEPKEEVN